MTRVYAKQIERFKNNSLLDQIMGNVSEWFVCPKCDETSPTAKQVIGQGNFSLNIECGKCSFRHVERDANSDNWNTVITVKQHLRGERLIAPKASRKAQGLVRCPRCESRDVEFWVYSDNSGLINGETVGHVRLDCSDCGEFERTNVSHH